MEAYRSTLTHSLTHLSALCFCITFKACPRIPGLFYDKEGFLYKCLHEIN